MGQEVIDLAGAKLSDRLAVERTVMAADRTLLAWVRTALSFISFGFTIFKVLEHVQQTGAAKLVREQTPRNIGIFMILIGIVPLALALIQYTRSLKRLGGRNVGHLNPNVIAAGAILLLGFALLLVTVMNLNVI